jgi:hypothetical protein
VVKHPWAADFAGISILVANVVKVVTGLGRGQVRGPRIVVCDNECY